jgi:hypothetical protein
MKYSNRLISRTRNFVRFVLMLFYVPPGADVFLLVSEAVSLFYGCNAASVGFADHQ